ncbi:MAG TPA: hypothetical protein VLX89_07985 [Actinomycetota bacterium]|nr:hypothetical protein [Actinomycetota bacterium]
MGYGAVVAGALIGLGFLIHPAESTDAAAQVASVASDPNRWYMAHLLIFVGLGFLIPSILLLMHRLSSTAPRLALGWGVVAFVGLVSVIAFVTVDAFVFWVLAKPGLDPATVRTVFDDLTKSAPLQVAFGPGILLNIGVFALAVGLYRSRGIPRWTAVAIAAGMAVQAFFGITYLHPALTVSAILLGAGFIGLGVDAIRASRMATDPGSQPEAGSSSSKRVHISSASSAG